MVQFSKLRIRKDENMVAALKAENMYGIQVNENNIDGFIEHFKQKEILAQNDTPVIETIPCKRKGR